MYVNMVNDLPVAEERISSWPAQ